MGIKGEERQAKGIRNRFNKIIAENISNLEKEMPIQVQELSRTPNRHDQNRSSPKCIIVKIISAENKEKILKAVRKNSQKNI
jgi:hypothetical protein